jgi:hypothetical protein
MSEEKYLIVKGVAGLGNRLITLAAAIEYAKRTNRKLFVDWSDGFFSEKGTNVFLKYFKLINVEYCKTASEISTISFYPAICSNWPIEYSMYDYFDVNQIKNRYLRKLLKKIIKQKWVVKNSVLKQWNARKSKITVPFGGDLPKEINEGCCIFSDYVPSYNPGILKHYIALQDWLTDEIDDFLRQKHLLDASVGVHIRATDKRYKGNLENFLIYLNRFCNENKIKNIYLATDNTNVEETMRNEFKDRLVVFPKFIPEVKDGGIHHWAKDNADKELIERMFKESIVDMFVLSKTTYLFYQKGSTFGEVSRVYQNKEENCFNWLNY